MVSIAGYYLRISGRVLVAGGVRGVVQFANLE